MRVVHVYKDYAPVVGGIENHIRVLAERQAAAGLEVGVLVCDPGGQPAREERAGVEILRARRLATALSMPISVEQPWRLSRLTADIVHVHSPYPLGEMSALACRRGARLLITYHCDVIRQRRALRLYAPLLRRVLSAADAIVATSPRYVTTSPWLAPVSDRCRVIPLGVDEARFRPDPTERHDEFTLLFVGRLRHYKGLDVLLRALIDLRHVRLVVVGDGPMAGAWRALAGELRVDDRVSFAGEVSDAELAAHYRRASALVLPSTSRAEAFGTVLLEAMASGLPCIATEIGTGTSWVVQHDETGIVVPPDDVGGLRDAILRLAGDPERAAAMGRAGRARVEAEFTERIMVERTTALYRELAGSDMASPLSTGDST
jgi:rhamnosyl/mannosyltransferase